MPKRDATRENIIKAAIEVFGRKSYRDALISEIAEKAKVAEGTIYQHFKNKEQLFFSIPEERTKAFSEGLNLHLEGIQDAPNKIAKFVWYYLYFFKTNPEYARIVLLEMRGSRGFAKTRGYRLIRKFTDLILDVIKEGQKEKTIAEDINPYIIRQLVLGVLEHGVTRWLLKGEKEDLLAFHAEIVNVVLNGVRRSGAFDKRCEPVEKTIPQEEPVSERGSSSRT